MFIGVGPFSPRTVSHCPAPFSFLRSDSWTSRMLMAFTLSSCTSQCTQSPVSDIDFLLAEACSSFPNEYFSPWSVIIVVASVHARVWIFTMNFQDLFILIRLHCTSGLSYLLTSAPCFRCLFGSVDYFFALFSLPNQTVFPSLLDHCFFFQFSPAGVGFN